MGKTVECEQKKNYYLFQKRILWYVLLSPNIRHAPLLFPIGLLLANIRLSPFEWRLLASVFSWHMLKHPISMALCWALSRYSWRDCHSYNSGNPIGPEHHILPVHIKPLISHSVCVCVWGNVGVVIFYELLKHRFSPTIFLWCCLTAEMSGFKMRLCTYCKMSASSVSLRHLCPFQKSLQCSDSL